jgi:hypothetical protein
MDNSQNYDCYIKREETLFYNLQGSDDDVQHSVSLG